MVTECGCPNEGGKAVKITITVGLVALVVFAAGLVVVFERMAPRIEAGLGFEPKQQYVPGGVSYDQGKTAPINQMPVNEEAAREKKKQNGLADSRMYLSQGNPARVSNKMFPKRFDDCATCPQVITQVSSSPSAPQPAPQPSGMTSTPTTPKYSISVFVGSDAKSQAFLDWWNKDSNLQELRKQTNFQAYTKDNPLYIDRYAKLIQPIEFPGVIVSDPNGGHVYAASGYHAPTSGAILYREIREAFDVHQRVVQPADTNPVNSDTFEFSSSSAQPNCPDGNCLPADRQPFLNPERERLFPIFKPQPKDPVQSILYWLWNPGEAILAVLCAFAFCVLLVVVLIKVLRS